MTTTCLSTCKENILWQATCQVELPSNLYLKRGRNCLSQEASPYFHPPKENSNPGHCVALSLRWIEWVQEHPDQITPPFIQAGDRRVAEISTRYVTNFFQHLRRNETSRVNDLALQQQLVEGYGKHITETVHLQGSALSIAEKMQQLPDGHYFINLPGHMAVLYRNQDQTLYYDPMHGVMNFDAKRIALVFALHYNLHIEQYLTLQKVSASDEEHRHTGEVSRDLGSLKEGEVQGKWQTLEYTFQGKVYHFQQHIETGQIFTFDTRKTVRIKGLLLALTTPFVLVIKIIDHFCTFFFAAAMALKSLITGKKLEAKRYGKFALENGIDIFRSIPYRILCLFAAIYTMIRPFEGRGWFGKLERNLNRSHHRENLLRNAYFHARCFTPINFGKEHLPTSSILRTFRKHVVFPTAIQEISSLRRAIRKS